MAQAAPTLSPAVSTREAGAAVPLRPFLATRCGRGFVAWGSAAGSVIIGLALGAVVGLVASLGLAFGSRRTRGRTRSDATVVDGALAVGAGAGGVGSTDGTLVGVACRAGFGAGGGVLAGSAATGTSTISSTVTTTGSRLVSGVESSATVLASSWPTGSWEAAPRMPRLAATAALPAVSTMAADPAKVRARRRFMEQNLRSSPPSGRPANGKGWAKSPRVPLSGVGACRRGRTAGGGRRRHRRAPGEGARAAGLRRAPGGTGEAALAALADAPRTEIVLLDLGLPDIDGYEVCRRIRASSTVPIIVITARGDEIDRVLGLELGADDYLVKPFGFRELVARIRAVTRRTAARDDVVRRAPPTWAAAWCSTRGLTASPSTARRSPSPARSSTCSRCSPATRVPPAPVKRSSSRSGTPTGTGPPRPSTSTSRRCAASSATRPSIETVRGVGFRLGTPSTTPWHRSSA